MIAIGLAPCDTFFAPGGPIPVGVRRIEVEAFKTAVADEGCMIATRQERAAVQSRTGFDDDTLSIITQYLTLSGESEPIDSGFRLTSGTCANA